jgi:hypothetical protein
MSFYQAFIWIYFFEEFELNRYFSCYDIQDSTVFILNKSIIYLVKDIAHGSSNINQFGFRDLI